MGRKMEPLSTFRKPYKSPCGEQVGCGGSRMVVYFSIFSLARPAGPTRTRPTNEPYWMGGVKILKTMKKIGLSRPEMLFLTILHNKICGW
jgi:hypothetical protein